mmetsp:Transcript_5199/g.13018  ORF Transcript_5199/g.13018 Transcript_5199/m.13018 type:complete len:234 (+) Transcript_5199:445-1146(+)
MIDPGLYSRSPRMNPPLIMANMGNGDEPFLFSVRMFSFSIQCIASATRFPPVASRLRTEDIRVSRGSIPAADVALLLFSPSPPVSPMVAMASSRLIADAMSFPKLAIIALSSVFFRQLFTISEIAGSSGVLDVTACIDQVVDIEVIFWFSWIISRSTEPTQYAFIPHLNTKTPPSLCLSTSSAASISSIPLSPAVSSFRCTIVDNGSCSWPPKIKSTPTDLSAANSRSSASDM